MMGAEKMLVNVNKGQDAYSVIGNYILNHITAIEDMIAVIQVNGVIMNELYMVDMDVDGYFYWNSDWWEGEEDVALIDFFPVSDAERKSWIPCSERLPIGSDVVLLSLPPSIDANGDELVGGVICGHYIGGESEMWGISDGTTFGYGLVSSKYGTNPTHWMPLPEFYRKEE